MGKRISSAITRTSILCFVLGAVLILAALYYSLNASVSATAKDMLREKGERYAEMVKGELAPSQSLLSGLGGIVEADIAYKTGDRSALQKEMLRAFEAFPQAGGMALMLEPDVYDGVDAEYVGTSYGTSRSGRVSYYYYRDDNGGAGFRSGTEKNEQEFSMPYYTSSKESKAPHYSDPYVYGDDNRLMITISCPLLSDSGRFLGVLAADLQLDRLRDELAEAEVYRSGYAIAVSEHGLLLGSAKRGDAGKPALDCGYNIPLPGKNEDVIFARLSVDGKSSLAFTLRTELDAGGGTYYVSVAAPVRELNAAAANPISTTAAMLILVGIIMILIVNRRSKFLLRPLAVINAKLLHYKATGSVKGDSGAEEADERLMQGKYESSEALRLLSELFERMGNHGELLKSAAERDLSQDVRVDDVIGRPLRELLMNLNGSFKAFQAAAGHLSALAQQNTAQLGRISQGITTQEAGLQNLAGTSHAMSEQTNETLRSAEAVFSLTESAGRRAANGARHMERIRVSMGDIRGAAAAVTQHIDEITAQSSILALNAAVEAARAGQKGSGLAVVADGIRKLSEKSAETARLTSDMISKSLEIIREADAAWERADAGVRELSSRNELINKRVQDIINSSRSEKSSIESMNEDIKRITRLLSEGAKKASEAERQSREAEARAQELIVEASGYKL